MPPGSFQEFVNNVETAEQSYDSVNDKDIALTEAEAAEICKESPREYVFGAGASKRIWNELYKVIDSSGTNCIKIGLPGKVILSMRIGLPEDLFS